MSKTESFLQEFGLHESCFDFDEHVKDFISEMEAGLLNRESSLLMLPSYLGVIPETPPDGEVIAIDAGGTNLRIALVRFEPYAAPVIERFEKYRLPGSDGAVSKDEFFTSIAEYIGDMTEESDNVGFCFSFPCEIGADRDGKIIWFDKEVKVNDSTGAHIGIELNAAFADMEMRQQKVTVLNDTVAALIGAVLAHGVSGMGGYIGLIYGTGVNICYYDPEKKMLINTETGGYGGFKQSVCDMEIDKESDAPGAQRFEKMVSGAYFSTVALKAIRLAAREGVFSPGTIESINALKRLDAIMIDAFMRASGGQDTELGLLCATKDDADILYEILDGLYERAAKLVAIVITAVLKRCGASAAKPGYIVAEGSSFSKGYKFRERFESYIPMYAGGEKSYELVLADDHALIGAAASVFL